MAALKGANITIMHRRPGYRPAQHRTINERQSRLRIQVWNAANATILS
jgi:hypothetical protein